MSLVKGWLKSQHNIHVHNEWVEACLDWLNSEHQGQTLNDSNLKSLVFEQWLGSDLSEIAPPVLPDGINKQVKIELKGSYCLQMNCIEDVSESAYSQLQMREGKVNDNVLVTATQPTQTQYNNVKSSRMLLLHLTDGHQSLQAMEYRPIPCLNTNIAPGTKVLVEGSIICRIGMLMLSAENIKVLGGEVDSLAETNSQIQLLSRALSDVSRNNIPEHFKNRITTLPITNDPERCKVVAKQWKGNVPGVNNNGAATDEDIMMEDDDLNDYMLQEIEMLERQHNQQDAEEWPDDGEQWPDDDDDEHWPDNDENWPDDVEQWPDDGEQWPDNVEDLLQSIPDDGIHPDSSARTVTVNNEHSMNTKPMNTENKTVCERKHMNTENKTVCKRSWNTTSSYTCWTNTHSNTLQSRKPSTNTISTQHRINKRNVQPQSAVTKLRPPDSQLDHNSKRKCFEEVIMISDDEEEDMKQCNKSKQEIISLVDALQLTQGSFKIKGHFTTLITGLSYDSSGWKLAAMVTDDVKERVLHVDLDDKVLSKLIGFTVPEMLLMKKEMKNNKKEVAQRIKSGLAECQEALKKMCCVMTIRKKNAQDQPCVIDVDYQKS